MQNDRESKDKVTSRFDFYRDGFRASLALNIILALGMSGDSWRDLYSHYHPMPPQIIGIDDSNRIKQIIPIEDPRMTDADLKDWVVREINQVCNLDWLHYKEQLNNAMAGFTDSGWNGLYAELERQKVPEALKEGRLEESCVPLKPALIRRAGRVNGVPAYDIEVPYSIGYYGQAAEKDRTAQALVSVQVTNVPTTKYPRGVAIFSVQFKPYQETMDGE
jgi:hypothetical protein